MRTTYAEIQAFNPFYGPNLLSELEAGPIGMFKEGLRILRSPTAMTAGIVRWTKLGLQIGSPFEEYQRDYGVYKKGDSKLKARLLEALGFSGGVQFNPDIALDNFLAAGKRL